MGYITDFLPVNNSLNVSVNTTLSWVANVGNWVSYKIYFAKSNAIPVLIGSINHNDLLNRQIFYLPLLDYNTRYHGRIEVYVGSMLQEIYGEFYFTTIPLLPSDVALRAINPSPSYKDINQLVDVSLSWSDGGGAT